MTRGGTGPRLRGIFLQRAQQISRVIGRERLRYAGSFIFAQAEIARIQNAGIIERPLDDISRFQHGGFMRGLANFHFALFTAVEDDAAGGIRELHFAIEHRKLREGARDPHYKLGSTQRTRRGRGADFQFARLFPREEISRTGRNIEAFLPRFIGRRNNLDVGQFIEPQDTHVGQAHGGAAQLTGLNPITDGQCGGKHGWLCPRTRPLLHRHLIFRLDQRGSMRSCTVIREGIKGDCTKNEAH